MLVDANKKGKWFYVNIVNNLLDVIMWNNDFFNNKIRLDDANWH